MGGARAHPEDPDRRLEHLSRRRRDTCGTPTSDEVTPKARSGQVGLRGRASADPIGEELKPA
jgi:hypothetical protein